TGAGRADPGARARKTDPQGVWSDGASADDRANDRRKKNAATSLSVTRFRSAPTSLLTSQYETLRRAALGEALPPQARGGLAVLLYHGMWGWARAFSAADLSPL